MFQNNTNVVKISWLMRPVPSFVRNEIIKYEITDMSFAEKSYICVI